MEVRCQPTAEEFLKLWAENLEIVHQTYSVSPCTEYYVDEFVSHYGYYYPERVIILSRKTYQYYTNKIY